LFDDDADGDAAVPRTSLSPFRRSLERTSNAFEHWAVSSVSLSCQLLISTREGIKASLTIWQPAMNNNLAMQFEQ
jgi:hypothetical protein